MDSDLVLVTGASGYIATHVVQQLQVAGYRVRGTVRSLKNEEKVKPLKELCPEAKHPLELVEADLTNADSWKEAVKDCTYVMHIASPFVIENPSDENVLIKPAVEGTVNVLNACKEVGTVKRVVLTSSVAAISGGFDIGGEKVFTEEDWSDATKKGMPAYYKSKTLAEKAAWDFMAELKEDEKFELAVITPSYVMGPILCGSFTSSMELPKRMLERAMPMLPKLNFAITDVRDVATAHVKAMTVEEAVGRRHIVNTGNMWIMDVGHIMREEFHPQGYNVPTSAAPYAIMWLYSFVDKAVKLLLPSIGKITKFDNTRMRSVLGVEPHDLKDTILDMCYSMIEAGKVKKMSKYNGPKYSTQR